MPSPIGHSLVGLIAYIAVTPVKRLHSLTDVFRENPKKLLSFVILANIPDMDMIAGYLFHGDFHIYHYQAAHSLLIAVFIAFIVASLLPLHGSRLKTFFAALLLVSSHDLMDSAASPDMSRVGTGVWLFYPLRERIVSPLPLFFGFQHKTLSQLISLHNLRIMGLELLEFGIILLILYWVKRARAHS